ncbi:MAG: hypothetical protein HUU35_20120, partial [Armatimonadetes bacterium]|nr:hypothetical protein [Armatimonadota bacterium]
MQTTAATPIVERYPPLTAGNPAYQGFRVLHVGFTLLPILAGADKFFGVLTDWTQYLAPQVPRLVNLPAQTFMMIVGGVEIVAGLLVGFLPKVGGWVVGLWLLGIIGNLLLLGGYYDVALRDFGLALGAFALARSAARFDQRASADC